ncbi:predicted protein [Histoplasma mississippiense (nom. inval.)]|uniref:predicted protein n=1 Tax=Ajellomyces capsulatus (strain NAm1 / WU24) TaxID=2059318 RepID=UPI000157BF12|nr:predicted protein [Histoplasma mississippiense (nom. inval.)]EDN06983.1 predicted protein [Histoplasma mississippiense (nom. inval.)]
MASKTGSIVDGGKYDVKELLERCNKLEQAFSAQGLKCNPPTLFSEEHGKLRAFLSQMDIYLAFTNQLQQTFGNIDEKHSAAQKLYQLKQTESITKYASEYQQLSSHLD